MNVAARVAGIAYSGQIVLTQTLVDALGDAVRPLMRPLGQISVKGRAERIAVLGYLWQPGEETVLGLRAGQSGVLSRRLRLRFGGQERFVTRQTGTLTLGRDRDCDVIVGSRQASRQHATIEVRGDRFVLIDHSANGTFVQALKEVEVCLRREELILPPEGHVALGLSTSSPDVTLIHFTVEVG